jgi:hypothetical protein
MKHRPIGLSHMIGKMAPDRLLAAEPKHIRAGQIRGSNAAINANRQTPDRRIIVELLEVLQILLQPIDFRLRLDAYITDGRRFANSRLLGFFRVHDDSSVGALARDHRDLRLERLEAETRGLYHVKKRFLYLYLNLVQQFFAVSMLFYRFRKMHDLQRSRQSAAIMPQASRKSLIFPPFF